MENLVVVLEKQEVSLVIDLLEKAAEYKNMNDFIAMYEKLDESTRIILASKQYAEYVKTLSWAGKVLTGIDIAENGADIFNTWKNYAESGRKIMSTQGVPLYDEEPYASSVLYSVAVPDLPKDEMRFYFEYWNTTENNNHCWCEQYFIEAFGKNYYVECMNNGIEYALIVNP